MIEVELPGARAVFSTRRGGVSEGPYESLNLGILTDDDPARVSENRRRLALAVGLDPSAVAMGWQVHGTEIREWEGAPPVGRDGYAAPGAELERVDGHVTAAEDLGLLVLVADCVPVALASPGRVAMLHCGWRGLAAGILQRALERFEAPPSAAVGPCIGPCCYEVGPDVLRVFGLTDRRTLDLRAIVEHRLRAGGVEQIEHIDHCTSCRADLYFSHRRDGGVTGRQAGLIWRSSSQG